MNNWTFDVKKRRRYNCQKKHFDQLIAILFSECVLFFDEQIVLFLNDFYQFSNFVLKKWKTKKRDKKSKNVFINSAILLFLFKPLPLFFMLLYSKNFYATCGPVQTKFPKYSLYFMCYSKNMLFIWLLFHVIHNMFLYLMLFSKKQN